MAVLKSELHLWTLKNLLLVSDTGLGCLTYHDKTDKSTALSPHTASGGLSSQNYSQDKQAYIESHGKVWTPNNKRPEKLRDHIKELEESLSSAVEVFTSWRSEDLILLLLSNGTVYWISVDQVHGDITKITKDTSLVGKISLTSLSDVVIENSYIALCSTDKSKLEIIYFTKSDLEESAHKKLSILDPKVYLLDLPGRPGRNRNRRIHVCHAADALLVHWPIASEEAWPWAPMTNEEERANLCVIALNGGRPSVLSYTKTECEAVDIRFSESSKLLSVERSINAKSSRADICTYELTKSCIHRTHHTSVPLSSTLVRVKWDNSLHNLILSSDDHSLMLYSENLKSTVTVRTEFQADMIEWHPSGALLLVLSSKGELQIFDKALSCLYLTLEGVEFVPQIRLSNFFRLSPHVKSISWCTKKKARAEIHPSSHNTLLITFDRGPVGIMKFDGGSLSNSDITCPLLISEYLKSCSFSLATKLLSVMSWSNESADCFQCLTNIMNKLLLQPLNKNNEDLLEATLGCFYAPQKALAEVIILEYRMHIGNLARRFFHHLVRYSKFDKAFLLAVDINARDLFMDMYYAALDSGQTRLAGAAKHKAKLCDEQMMFSDSGSSSLNADLLTDDDFYSSSDEASIVDTQEHAEAIVQCRLNGHAPPLPPRKAGSNPPALPPRWQRGRIVLSAPLQKTPSSGESTPPLPPRSRLNCSPPQNISHNVTGEHSNQKSFDEVYSKKMTRTSTMSANKYHHMTGCTLPSGYSYDLDPDVSQRIIDDFNSMMVDETFNYNQVPDVTASSQNMERKQVKVIHFGLV